jgi:hypothetical protein
MKRRGGYTFITCSGVEGTTLEVTSQLLEKRMRILGERCKDAVIATAINVLVSLRAGTRTAKKNRKIKPVVREVTSVYPSWSAHGPRRVLRMGSRGQRPRGAQWHPNGLKVRYLTKGFKDRDLKVFQVFPEHESVRPYYVVAADKQMAIDHERAAAKKRIDKFGSLARWALGVAMNKLSTRSVRENVSERAALAGSRLAIVENSGGANAFAVRVVDLLEYALDALRGSGEVESAFQRAANKTSGLIRRHMYDLGSARLKLVEGVPTPFPDIIRGR